MIYFDKNKIAYHWVQTYNFNGGHGNPEIKITYFNGEQASVGGGIERTKEFEENMEAYRIVCFAIGRNQAGRPVPNEEAVTKAFETLDRNMFAPQPK